MRQIFPTGSAALVLAARVGLALALVFMVAASCGKKKEETPPPEKIRVSLLDPRNEMRLEVFQEFAVQFAESHPGTVVECATKAVNPDGKNLDPAQWLADTDVAVIPSYLNSAFRNQPNSFYPISQETPDIPSVIQMAYAGATPASYWAQPLVIDPYVLVTKKRDSADASPPAEWQEILLDGTLFKRAHRYAGTPVFVFLIQDPFSLADSVAAHQLSFGYGRDFLHAIPLEDEVTPEINRQTLARALQNMKRFILDDPNARVVEVPKADDLPDFVRNEPFVTIAQLSVFHALPPQIQASLFVTPLPTPYKQTVACQVIAAGVPIGSGQPSRGEQWIAFLRGSLDNLAQKLGGLPARIPSGGAENALYPPETVFLPRENTKILSHKNLIDALNGDLNPDELEKLWTSAFFLPPHKI
ncbi:MAG: hypothetical protein ACE15F_10250 [bacterium]